MEDSTKPKVVLALIPREGKFLLVERRVKAMKVSWAFPGGVTLIGETEEEAVVREAKEETDVEIEIVEKLLERKHPNTYVQTVYFHCKTKDGEVPKVGEPNEIEKVEWVDAGEVMDRFTSDVHPKIEEFIKSHIK